MVVVCIATFPCHCLAHVMSHPLPFPLPLPLLSPSPSPSPPLPHTAYLIEDSAHLEERTAESERIIATLVSNLEPQPPKDEVQRMAYNGSEEELQLQLSEVLKEGGGGGGRERGGSICMLWRCVYINSV